MSEGEGLIPPETEAADRLADRHRDWQQGVCPVCYEPIIVTDGNPTHPTCQAVELTSRDEDALLAMVKRAFPDAQPVVPLAGFARAVEDVEALGGSINLEGRQVVVKVPGGVPVNLRFALGAHLDLLRAVAIGRTGTPHPTRETGGTRHALGICDVCGEPSMVAVSRGRLASGKWPACRMTPDCEGRHVPLDRALSPTNGRQQRDQPR